MTEISTLFGTKQIQEEQADKKTDEVHVWTFISDISKTKKYLFSDDTSKAYEPWIVNKSFSSHIDTLATAEAANRMHHIDKRMQHDFMFYSVPAHPKRYKPWLKKSDSEKREQKLYEDIGTVTGLNVVQTKKFWNILSTDQKDDFLIRYVYPDMKNTLKLKKK
jgi:hypothetical protein